MIAEDRAKMKQEQEQGKWFRGGDAAAMPLFPREMFTGLNTGICTKGYATASGEMWLYEIKHDGFRLIAQTVSGAAKRSD